MTLQAKIAPELPYLRRYARAMMGSQPAGDTAVRATLEAILAAPDEFNRDVAPRVELYRIFHQVWGRDAVNALSETASGGDLSPRSRAALLLCAVEGFAVDDAAVILVAPSDILATEIEDARVAIAEQLRSDILIIEDEAVIAMHISAIVRDIGHNVVGIARTRNEALDMALDQKPELVLADISLADGSSGVDAVTDILASMDVPVIFVTAFPERLLTGERPEPTYLLTKPFEPIMLTATIAQALIQYRQRIADVAHAA